MVEQHRYIQNVVYVEPRKVQLKVIQQPTLMVSEHILVVVDIHTAKHIAQAIMIRAHHIHGIVIIQHVVRADIVILVERQ